MKFDCCVYQVVPVRACIGWSTHNVPVYSNVGLSTEIYAWAFILTGQECRFVLMKLRVLMGLFSGISRDGLYSYVFYTIEFRGLNFGDYISPQMDC